MAAPARCIRSRSTGAAPPARIGGPAASLPPCPVSPRHSEDGLREAAASLAYVLLTDPRSGPRMCAATAHGVRGELRGATDERLQSGVPGRQGLRGLLG